MSDDESSVIELLSGAQFLAELSAGDLDKVAEIASVESFQPSTVLFQEGTVCEHVHLVTSGLVGLDMCMPRRGCVRILTVSSGELVGWSALLADGMMTARATVIEPTTVVAFPAQQLRELCHVDHDVGYAVMKLVSVALARRLLATRLQVLDVFGETQPVQTTALSTSALSTSAS